MLGGTRADERDENRDDSRRPTHAVVELHVGPARHMIEWCLSSVSVERVAVGVPVAVLGMRALIECGGQSRVREGYRIVDTAVRVPAFDK